MAVRRGNTSVWEPVTCVQRDASHGACKHRVPQHSGQVGAKAAQGGAHAPLHLQHAPRGCAIAACKTALCVKSPVPGCSSRRQMKACSGGVKGEAVLPLLGT